MSKAFELLIEAGKEPNHCYGLRAAKKQYCMDLDKECPYLYDDEASKTCPVYKTWYNNCKNLLNKPPKFDHWCKVFESPCPFLYRREPANKRENGEGQCGQYRDSGDDVRDHGGIRKSHLPMMVKQAKQGQYDMIRDLPTPVGEDPVFFDAKKLMSLTNDWKHVGRAAMRMIAKERAITDDNKVEHDEVVRELVLDAQRAKNMKYNIDSEHYVILKQIVQMLYDHLDKKYANKPQYKGLLTAGLMISQTDRYLQMKLPWQKQVNRAMDQLDDEKRSYSVTKIGDILGVGDEGVRNVQKELSKKLRRIVGNL